MNWGVTAKGEEWCRNCGDRATDLHHAIPRSRLSEGRTNLLNGLPLCHWCHMGWHMHTTILSRDLFTGEEWAWLRAHENDVWLDRFYPERDDDLPF